MSAAVKTDAIDIIDLSARPALGNMFRRMGELTTLPSAAQRVMALVSDASSTATDLLAVVEGDPVLAAKVLRRVNSAYYSLRNSVADLRSAISLLGFREIRNLALTVYLARIFDEGVQYRTFSRQGLWDHSVAAAQAARLVATTCRRDIVDEAYLAGLLHDLGLILLDRFLPKYLFQIVDRVNDGADTCEAETELLSFDHTQLGAYVARQWNFPSAVIAATAYHHNPLAAPEIFHDMTCTVAVANYLCHRADHSSLGVANIGPPPDEAFAHLELSPDRLASVWDRFQQALCSAPSM